jgi:single-stranded-DNA-specific exonuclease
MVQSVQGRRWIVREAARAGEDGGPGLVQRLLTLRGVRSRDEARDFLHGGASADPDDLPGMGGVVSRILDAIADEERIAVYGDYDVDGVTATAILSEGIRDLGGDVITHIPDRFTDGYGLTRAGLRAVRDRGARLVITVDCGINANAEVEYAAEIGLDVVVLDHHEPPPVLPEAAAIVDPKLGGGPPAFDGLASCGLAFTVLRALCGAAGVSPDESRFLDLVALGTVADMVPLLGENRRLVRAGLKALRGSSRPGVHALLAVADIEGGSLTTEAIAFRLAPRLNAAGRLEHAALALDLLTTPDEARAADLARHLNDLNARRQRMTDEALDLARQLAAEECTDSPLIMVGHEQIAQGIVGLVAGKLVEELYRPSIVYERGAEVCRGSVRSIREMDAVRCLAQGDALMERWGGHSQAGGFSAHTDRVPRLKAVLSEWASRELEGVDLRPAFEADLEVPLAQIRAADLRWLPYFEPCGQENPAPAFVSRGVPVMKSWTVGADGRHLRLKLRDGVTTWDAVAFNLGHAAPRPGTRIDLLYSIAPDRRGFGMELRLRDFAPAE